MDDTGIIDLYWQRDQRAISETQAKYGTYCNTIAYNILRSREDAEECVNDVLQAAWDAIPPGRPENLRAWLGRVVRNAAINRWHKERVGKRYAGMEELFDELAEVLPAPHAVEQELESKEIAEEIACWLKGQSDQDRFDPKFEGVFPETNDLAEEYAVVYVPAVKVEGLEDYFARLAENHQAGGH